MLNINAIYNLIQLQAQAALLSSQGFNPLIFPYLRSLVPMKPISEPIKPIPIVNPVSTSVQSTPSDAPKVSEPEEKKQEPELEKLSWQDEYDETLLKISVQYKNDWKKITRRFRILHKIDVTPTFLKTRLKKIKSPSINHRAKFSHDEDLKLIACIKLYGKDWIKIAAEFANRGPISLKNRYYCSLIKTKYHSTLLNELADVDLSDFIKQAKKEE